MKKKVVKLIQYIKDKPTRKTRRRILLFLFCLILAFFSWLLNILGKTYSFELEIPLVFENVPEYKTLITPNSHKILCTIEGSGWFFIKAQIEILQKPLRIDVRKFADLNEIDLKENIERFNKQIVGNAQIIDVSPRKIRYTLDDAGVKKVPVIAHLKLSFAKEYALSNTIKYIPDSVLIAGSKSALSSINFVETESMEVANINSYTRLSLALVKLNNNISFDINEVKVEIPVDKYTEDFRVIPLQIKGYMGSDPIRLFPSVCTLSYQVGLGNFSKVKMQELKLVAMQDPNDQSKLSVYLVDTPDYMLYPRVFPDKVDYLMLK